MPKSMYSADFKEEEKCMRLKRHLKCTAVLSALCVGMLFPMAVQADPEYETKQVDTYLFDNDHNDTKTTLVFKSDLPTIPYINAEDYLNTVYKANDFEATKQEDGTYRIKSAASEYYMTVDPDTDLVTYNEYANFTMQRPEAADNMDTTFIKEGDGEFIGGEKSANYNLGKYGIDVMEIDGEVYFPIATLNDMFKEIYNAAQYLDGNLYFLHSSDMVMGSCYYDRKSQFDLLERSQKEAEFNYNELCFMMDNTYGAPSRSKLADKILKDGFDQALESSDKLKKAKTYLKSQSMVDYVIGLYYIGADLFDGGHMTPIQDIAGAFQAYPNSPLVLGIMEAINKPERAEDKKVCGEYEELCGVRTATLTEVSTEKVKTVGSQYRLVKEWADSNAGLYVAGDTAFFTFDNFVIPVVEQFKWSVDYAAENGYKNFVVDLSTNNGGVTQVASYMLALMSNKERKTNTFTDYIYYRASDELSANTCLIDLNLDGKFDDADKKVVYDLNFAILETSCAFSSGNLMPVRAKEMGIAILGENSGGGGCALLIDFMSCGYFMNISGMPKFRAENPDTDVDLGAKPDYEFAYSKMFDPDLLSTKIHEYYKNYKSEWVDGYWYNKDGKQSYQYKSSWKTDKTGKKYVDTSGKFLQKQWAKIDGKEYYFNADGYLGSNEWASGYKVAKDGTKASTAKYSWNTTKKGTRYKDTKGNYLKKQWATIDGKKYYFNADGFRVENQFLNGHKFNKNGTLASENTYSWKKTKTGTRYQDTKGNYLKKQWATINGKRYYFQANGCRLENQFLNGYKFNKNGVASDYKYSWKKTKNGVRYQDTKGNYVKKQWATINGKRYYFKATGYRAAGEWLNGYKFNNNGTQTYKYKAAWKKTKKGVRFVASNGWYAKSQTLTINGKKYKFNKNGYRVK